MVRSTLFRPVLGAVFFAAVASGLRAQQPLLTIDWRALSRPQGQSMLSWQMVGPPGEVFVMLADVATGQPNVFGADFDLAFSPSLLFLDVGILNGGNQSGFLGLTLAGLPANAAMHLQYGSWDPNIGLSSMRASNLDSFFVHDENAAVVIDFGHPAFPVFGMTGVFDKTVHHRLQALPPVVRTVRPSPAEAMPWPFSTMLTPFNPNGARCQHAVRASDLGSIGVPEWLVAVRWRPLFGNVTAQTLPQFELRAALADAVPDYAIDPWSALPVDPGSGLSTTFAANAIPGTEQVLFSGAYSIFPGALTPGGHLPYPIAQPFLHDGVHTLLLETRCAPGAGTGVNFPLIHLLSNSSPEPFATVAAIGGWAGFPAPLSPSTTPVGNGGSYTFDLEVDFLRTRSVAESAWTPSFGGALDYGIPTLASFAPPGTSILVEYRGRTASGAPPTAWSTTPDVADGMNELQIRVTMEANAATGAVPWVDMVAIPFD
ncbi:MAG: hypothetical protein JNK78_19935 [Planctomycetes bacterium]|nr:hypothetical protein [Planctomycetota bacterium]